MSAAGALRVAGVECAKLAAQWNTRAVLGACAAGPFMFATAMKVQSGVPEDTLFGRSINESGFATPLVVLGFAALWVFPALAGIVGGDLFAAEDRYGTWKTVLTRARSRAEVFGGKTLTALVFSLVAVSVLAVSSVAAGLLFVGHEPLVDLSGTLLAPRQALGTVALAWASVLPPVLGFTALAVLLSIATRNSVAGVGLPVITGLVMQLFEYVDGAGAIRRVLITSAFGAWHGLLIEPPLLRPLTQGTAVSGAYLILCLVAAYEIFRRRDIGG